MLKIRLTRKGAKKKPFYRIVVAEESHARDGRFVQMLGYYNPRVDPIRLEVDLARANYWISKGAKPTETVSHLLKLAEARKAEQPAGTLNQPVEPTKEVVEATNVEATNVETANTETAGELTS